MTKLSFTAFFALTCQSKCPWGVGIESANSGFNLKIADDIVMLPFMAAVEMFVGPIAFDMMCRQAICTSAM